MAYLIINVAMTSGPLSWLWWCHISNIPVYSWLMLCVQAMDTLMCKLRKCSLLVYDWLGPVVVWMIVVRGAPFATKFWAEPVNVSPFLHICLCVKFHAIPFAFFCHPVCCGMLCSCYQLRTGHPMRTCWRWQQHCSCANCLFHTCRHPCWRK